MIASNHRVVHMDQMAFFRGIPNSESLSYIVRVHAIPGGQRVIAQIPSRRQLDGSIPALAHCALQHRRAREQ
jgi:hypothetical protein